MARKPASGNAPASTDAKPTETKNEKFRRISRAKGAKAVTAIRQLGAVATKAYAYSQAEADALVKGLELEVVALHKKLSANIQPATAAANVDFDPFAALDKPAPALTGEGEASASGEGEAPATEPATV